VCQGYLFCPLGEGLFGLPGEGSGFCPVGSKALALQMSQNAFNHAPASVYAMPGGGCHYKYCLIHLLFFFILFYGIHHH
jgi:hypothetical protein